MLHIFLATTSIQWIPACNKNTLFFVTSRVGLVARKSFEKTDFDSTERIDLKNWQKIRSLATVETILIWNDI